jgi:hypothetical protein
MRFNTISTYIILLYRYYVAEMKPFVTQSDEDKS